jgi:hypothetical protein
MRPWASSLLKPQLFDSLFVFEKRKNLFPPIFELKNWESLIVG